MSHPAPILKRVLAACDRVARPRALAAMIGLIVLVNIIGMLTVPLHPDETYYWLWSQRPGLSYFDHPPMVAWLMAPFSALLGKGLLGVRLLVLAGGLVSMVAVYRMARLLAPDRPYVGIHAALVFMALPITQIGFNIITPDTPLILFTALAYLAMVHVALVPTTRGWLVVGLLVGLALLSKYNGVLLGAIIALSLFATRAGRLELMRPGPWLAGMIALIVFMPVVVWNALHDWASFRFQWGHGVDTGQPADITNVLKYLASQLGAALPWVFVLMAVLAVRARRLVRSPLAAAVLGIGFVFPLLFFAVTGLRIISGANWPAMAYIPGAVLAGLWLDKWLAPGVRFRALRLGLLVASLALSLLLITAARYRIDSQMTNAHGWDAFAEAIQHERGARDCRVLANYWATGAALAHALGPDEVLVLDRHKTNQFDFWRKTEDARRTCVLAVVQEFSGQFKPQLDLKEDGLWVRRRVFAYKAPARARWFAIYVPASAGGSQAR